MLCCASAFKFTLLTTSDNYVSEREIIMKNISVEEFTSPCPVTVKVSTPFHEIVRIMESREIRHIPVLSEENLPIGIISDRDVNLALSFHENKKISAEEVMTPEPYTVREETSLEEVALNMSKEKIGSALVVNAEGKLVGVFTSTDALNALIEIIRGDV